MAGIVGVDAFERGGEAVGIALAADFAVGDDVDAGALHVADGEDGGVVLRLLEIFLRQRARSSCMRMRGTDLRQHRAVDQPFRLRIASDHGGRQQMLGQVHLGSPCFFLSGRGLQTAPAAIVFAPRSGRRACRSARSPLSRSSRRIAALNSHRHHEHHQHAGEHMRAVEHGAVARHQIADAGRRGQHLRHHHADDGQRAAERAGPTARSGSRPG